MVSSHSQTALRKCAQEFWIKESIWQEDNLSDSDIEKIHDYLIFEYNTIPEKERIGKERFFIAKMTAQGITSLISHHREENLFESILTLFKFAEKHEHPFLRYFSLVLAGEITSISVDLLIRIFDQVLVWVDHSDWEVRETAVYIIRKGLKFQPDRGLSILDLWSQSPSENVRRAVTEGLRPLADIKWLRNTVNNDQILHLLSQLKCDPSTYVRTSVGNNLKDLTKYMPEKILSLAEKWISDYNITVVDDLASHSKKELGSDQYFLVWILKHAFRWIQKRNPEFYLHLTFILGTQYVAFFDEKRNKLARPMR